MSVGHLYASRRTLLKYCSVPAALHQIVDALEQQLLFFGKGEIHGFPFLCFPHPCLTFTTSHDCAAILISN